MVTCDPASCEKKCSSHESNEEKIKRTSADLEKLEITHGATISKLSAIDARLTVFTWICGLLLLSMISLSLYGIVQLNAFKDRYYQDMLKLQGSILRNSALIERDTTNPYTNPKPNRSLEYE